MSVSCQPVTVISAAAAKLRGPQAENAEHPLETEPSSPQPARAGLLKKAWMSNSDEFVIEHLCNANLMKSAGTRSADNFDS